MQKNSFLKPLQKVAFWCWHSGMLDGQLKAQKWPKNKKTTN